MNKTCTVCKQTKLLSEYNKKKTGKDGLQPHCRECSHEKFQLYYSKNRAKHHANVQTRNKKIIQEIMDWLSTIKQVGCTLCPEKNSCCMDFHHLDPSTKVSEVGVLVKNQSYRAIVDEINKCVLLCANCHRKVHNGLITVNSSMLCKVKNPKEN